MKQQIKKLLYPLLMAFISIGISFNTEARLPKYMAQRAAELLIEKSKLQLKAEATKEAFAAKLVDFLYSTEKRQHLANWMKRRLPFKVHGTPVAWKEDENDFKSLLDDIDGAFNDNEVFRMFVNQRFPCWTGTLTCFMLSGNNVANKALSEGKVVERCQESLNSTDGAYKVVGILFTLELVDSWNDIQRICKNESENLDSRRLRASERVEEDQYECVPLPNTVYKINESQWWDWRNTQGSCMVSTIHNLLCVLCRNKPNGTIEPSENLRQEVRAHLSDLNSIVEGSCNASKKDFVAGTTNPHKLGNFAKKIRLDNKYEPTLALFLSTLSNLLHTALYSSTVYHDITVLHGLESECMEHIKGTVPNSRERSQALSEYYGHKFFQSYVQLLARQDGSSILTSLFELITGHLGRINVTLRKWPEVTYQKKTVKNVTLNQNWPEYQLIITDQVVDKTIIIGIGHSGGGGQHIEIIDIKGGTNLNTSTAT